MILSDTKMKAIVIVLLLITLKGTAQNSITFQVEELSAPEKLLIEKETDIIIQKLINAKEANEAYHFKPSDVQLNYNIIAKSHQQGSLVHFSNNTFFNGMYQAYADHRPFVLSPDMIWLLISQGFAQHVNANPEGLRKHFVSFSGKSTLKVGSDIDFVNISDWESLFNQFTSQIAEHTGKELVNTLKADFSTTTSVERVASEITIMNAMDPYFEYLAMYIVCGIPEITIHGTPEDWQKILDKTHHLSKYDLSWWTKELEPILKEFIAATNGKINQRFWRNMFKYHTPKEYGAEKIIDGWIVKFYPYDKYGKRNNLKYLEGGRNLPEDLVKVNLKFVKTDGISSEETMLELFAGFIGLRQNKDNYALTPQIGWMIKEKDVNNNGQLQMLRAKNLPCRSCLEEGISLKIKEVPEILKELDEIYMLELTFINSVEIPEWLKEKRIGNLSINGKMTKKEIWDIVQWFPNTTVTINYDEYNRGKNGWVTVYGKLIPEEALASDHIWVLEFAELPGVNGKYFTPELLFGKKIEIISFSREATHEEIQKFRMLFPATKIYLQGKEIDHKM